MRDIFFVFNAVDVISAADPTKATVVGGSVDIKEGGLRSLTQSASVTRRLRCCEGTAPYLVYK